ncbi:MAG TPA: hypothetical protein VMY42_10385 [Thermoguttaceae bacterium]|nr:hypothetical protein [Thermoguttaceae bacterium]
MRSPRGILTTLLLVVLLAAAGGVVVALKTRLPHPTVADRDQLLRWLAVRDLSTESVDLQRTLGLRLEEEFGRGDGIDWQSLAERLDESRRQRVWDNVLVLIEPWLIEKTTLYFELAPSERAEYIDRFIDTIGVFRGVDTIRPAAESFGRGGLLKVLAGQVESWKTQPGSPPTWQIEQFLREVKVQWVRRKLAEYWSALGSMELQDLWRRR